MIGPYKSTSTKIGFLDMYSMSSSRASSFYNVLIQMKRKLLFSKKKKQTKKTANTQQKEEALTICRCNSRCLLSSALPLSLREREVTRVVMLRTITSKISTIPEKKKTYRI